LLGWFARVPGTNDRAFAPAGRADGQLFLDQEIRPIVQVLNEIPAGVEVDGPPLPPAT
jgi:hypothetical protein